MQNLRWVIYGNANHDNVIPDGFLVGNIICLTTKLILLDQVIGQ